MGVRRRSLLLVLLLLVLKVLGQRMWRAVEAEAGDRPQVAAPLGSSADLAQMLDGGGGLGGGRGSKRLGTSSSSSPSSSTATAATDSADASRAP